MEKVQTPFYIWKVGDTEYKLRIDTAKGIELEKKLGTSLVKALERIDSLQVISTFLWGAMQKYNHGIKEEDIYEIYDQFVDEGNTLEDAMGVILEVLECSGFIKPEQVKEAKAKKDTKA